MAVITAAPHISLETCQLWRHTCYYKHVTRHTCYCRHVLLLPPTAQWPSKGVRRSSLLLMSIWVSFPVLIPETSEQVIRYDCLTPVKVHCGEWGTGHHYIGARRGWRDQGVICNILLQNFSDISDKSISNTNRIRIKLLSNNNFSLVAINNPLTLRKYCAETFLHYCREQ